jgi:hypothetical protein
VFGELVTKYHMQCHEIAEVLNPSLGTVMSRLFYGRKGPISNYKRVMRGNRGDQSGLSAYVILSELSGRVLSAIFGTRAR